MPWYKEHEGSWSLIAARPFEELRKWGGGVADKRGGADKLINMDILGRWIWGEGLHDYTWRVLLGVLRKANCVELAESVEEALTDEEAEQGKP